MKVYISCHHPDPANELASKLVVAGHQIVSTWHTSNDVRPSDDDAEKWAENAKRNFDQIVESDAFVLIASPAHLSREKCVPGGKFVEAGFAVRAKGYGHGHRIFTLGGVENGMLFHPNYEHAKDADELLSLLS